jgi:L-asparaginase
MGVDTLDLIDYGSNGVLLEADEIVARVPELATFADVLPVRFRTIPSFDVTFTDWQQLVALCADLVAQHLDLAGIVIGHGTASMEETAYFLNLTLTINVPVVMVGSQRPINALSSDAGMNLVNAVRTAAAPEAWGMGVLVVLNDEIHAARDVTKTSTLRLQTFQAPDFGALGHVDRDRVSFYRKSTRAVYPDASFDIASLTELPRVDMDYAHLGSDGTAVRAFIAAGARGIVSAGFAPGYPGRVEDAVLKEAASQGVIVVQSRRSASGRIAQTKRLKSVGALSADNLNPEKARILLALALTVTNELAEIERMFAAF